jgi:thiamine biosynthesis lipoprotein
MSFLRILKIYIIILIFPLLFTGCKNEKSYFEYSGYKHTFFRIKYNHTSKLDADFDKLFQTWYKSLNVFDSTSVATKINRNEQVEVDSLFAYTINKARDISAKTDGYFDVTCSPLINIWGFGTTNRPDSISQLKIDSLLQFVGYRKIRLEGSRIIKDDPRVTLNFSGLGDGAICDLVAAFLDKKGVEDYLVEIGGDDFAKGLNPTGIPWKIGINKPADDPTGMNTDIEQIVQVKIRMAVATSGNYRNFYVKNGKRYSHTINPKTGYPANQNILSATVIGPDGLTADALATAFMAMGTAKARKVKENFPGYEYFFISAGENEEFKAEYSKGMQEFLAK